MNRTCTYLGEIAAHLAAFELAEPASIHVRRYDQASCIQLDAHGLKPLAAELLAWADTITVDGLEVWRPPEGASVHLDLCGHLSSFLALRIYGAIGYRPSLFPDLQPGGRLPLSLTVLRAWAEEGAVA
jgi:hypothetical protein